MNEGSPWGRWSLIALLAAGLLSAACAPPPAAPSPAGSPQAVSTAGESRSDTVAPNVGDPAPDFVLPTPDGRVVKLADLHGHPVLLNFWATWCGPCRQEMPELQAFYDDRHPKGLEIIAIDIQESAEDVAHYRQSLGINFPTVLDADGTVTRRYQIRGVPTPFFIDADGTIQDLNTGPLNRRALERRLNIMMSS